MGALAWPGVYCCGWPCYGPTHSNPFLSHQPQGRGYITRAQFIESYNRFFLPSSSGSATTADAIDPTLARLLARLDGKKEDRIDYVEWSNTLTLKDVPQLTR